MENQQENQPAHAPAGMGSVIHLSFTDIIRFLCRRYKKAVFGGYFMELRTNTETEMHYYERHGILMAYQIMLQLYTDIISDVMDLDEALVIDMFQETDITFDHFSNA